MLELWIELETHQPSANHIQPSSYPRESLTSKKERQSSQCPVFSFKSFQKGRQGEDVHQRVEKANMYQWECICSIHYSYQFLSAKPPSFPIFLGQKRTGNVLLANPISFGIKDPQACTSHTLCIPSIQSRIITKIMERVKRGSRKIYDRMRAAENCGRLGAIVSCLWQPSGAGSCGDAVGRAFYLICGSIY